MEIKNWITCVRDRAKWMSLGRPKPPTKGVSVPDGEEEDKCQGISRKDGARSALFLIS